MPQQVRAVSGTWTQTSQVDFQSGSGNYIDTTDSQGDIKIEKKLGLFHFNQDLTNQVDSSSAIFARNSSAINQSGEEVSAESLRYDDAKFNEGIYIGEGTTNLLLANQSQIEEGLIGFNTNNSATLSRSTTEKWDGSYSLKTVTSGLTVSEGFYTDSTSGSYNIGDTFTASLYLKGTGTLSLYLWGTGANGAGTPTDIVLSDNWQQFQVTRSLTASATGLRIYLHTGTDVQAITFYADALQIEQKDYATSWQKGKLTVDDSVTNLLTVNQSTVETNLTGFTANFAATLLRTTDEYYQGTASLKVTTAGSTANEGFYTTSVVGTFLQGATYTSSAWIKGSGTISFMMWSNAGSSTTKTIILEPDNWQKVTVSLTLTANSNQLRIYCKTSTAQATTFYVDELKIHEGLGYHYDNNSRVDEVLKITNSLLKNQGSIAFWVKGYINENPGFYWFDEGHFSAKRATSSYLFQFSDGTNSVNDNDVGAVTIVFDDARSSAYTIAFPIMQQYGIKGSIAVPTDLVGTAGKMTLSQLHELQNAGWSIVSHTKTHPDLTTLSDAEVDEECRGSRQWLIDNGFTGYNHFVVPSHLADSRVINICKQYYTTIRWDAASTGETIPPADYTKLIGRLSSDGDSDLSAIKSFWDTMMQTDRWGYVYFHELTNASNFENFISYLSANYSAHVKTYEEFFGSFLTRRNVDNFNHFVFTWGEGSLKLYINGELEDTSNFTAPTILNDWLYLLSDSLGDQQANAIIDELQLYNRAFSQDEITNLYNATSASGIYNSTSATFISSDYDTGNLSDFGNLTWTATTPTNTLVKFQIRTASTEAGLASATYYGPTGTNDYYTSNNTDINSIHNSDRWVQYKAVLETTDINNTPTLSEVNISYTAIDIDYGGPSLPSVAFSPPTTPTTGFKVMINQGASATSNRIVNLSFSAGSDVKKMAISMTGDFSDASQEDYQVTKQIDLCSKFGGMIKNLTCPDGAYTVFVKFYTQYGQASEIVKAVITYKTSGQTPNTQNNSQAAIAEQIAQIKQQLILLITQLIQMLTLQMSQMQSLKP